MDRLTFSDVRCFRGDNAASFAPLTLVVGENSTGKSTFLALTRIAWDIAYGSSEPDFNEEPFQLGSFDDIAHYHGGQGKRAKNFSVGLETRRSPARDQVQAELFEDSRAETTSVTGTFASSSGTPALSSVTVKSGLYSISGNIEANGVRIVASAPTGQFDFVSHRPLAKSALSVENLSYGLSALRYAPPEKREDVLSLTSAPPDPRSVQSFMAILDELTRSRRRTPGRGRSFIGRPYAIAPIRTKPKRTYDPLRETPSPDGNHVPLLLARLSSTEEFRFSMLADELRAFGTAAGLFESLKVKRFEEKEGSPFQLRVLLTGQKKEVNLVDVGYGISQILPVLVDCLTTERASLFLMQQPEVHLHPKAQAQIGTFLCHLVKRSKHRFVVETHSDYLLDRVCLEVRQGTLPASAVRILFFSPQGASVQIHEITLDKEGNLERTPPEYRNFFLAEQLRLVGG